MRQIWIFLKNRKVSIVGFFVLCWLMLFMSGLTYAWWVRPLPMSAGGGTSSGGSYTLTGTIGQPITGSSSGGPYVLTSGFLPARNRPIPLESEPEPEPLPH